jgi:molybdopterin-guanine dinucleotide biosynthesis protein A
MIGAAGRNAGKTLLACEIIRRHSLGRSVVAAKVTTVHEGGGPCPRGNKGCGVCSSLTGPYTLTEERGHVGGKDTTRLLAAGASPVYWLCARPSYLGEGTSELMASVPRDAALVVESNSLRRVVEPGLFVLVQHEQSRKIKPSCREVWPFADAVVRFDGERFDHLPEAFSLVDGRWALRRHATAIVLAGGKSSRMGRDKALLPIGDLTMIEYIVAQLRPHFSQILVSSNDPERYAFLGLEVVPDRSLGKGPMMAVASTLERASYDLSFVIPCDVPRVHIPLMNRLLRAGLAGAEVAVPVTPESHYEPLFAVYRRSVRTLLDRALAKGERRLYSVYDDCDTAYFQMREADQLHNVNTTAEYEKMLADDPSLSCS